MKLAPIPLAVRQVQQLERTAATGSHPRKRRRAQAVLSYSRGLTLSQLAAAYAVDHDTVREWLTRFEQGGVAALAEGHRTGRPPKLTAAAKKVVAWVGQACQQVRQLVPQLWRSLGILECRVLALQIKHHVHLRYLSNLRSLIGGTCILKPRLIRIHNGYFFSLLTMQMIDQEFLTYYKNIIKGFRGMKRSFWYGIGSLLLALPLHAQTLSGAWQGVENEPKGPRYWPAVLRLQGKDDKLFGVLYEEVGGQPGTTSTFQVKGSYAGSKLQISHERELDETGSDFSYWCAGSVAFTYDAAQEKLTGHAAYQPIGKCNTGTYIFYRVKLKSAATVPAGALSTLRVSGRDVRWFADPELKQPVGEGNTRQARLTKTTTYYLTQGFYPSAEKLVTPITIAVKGAAKAPPRPTAPTPRPAPPAPIDSAATPPAAVLPPTPLAPAPLVLPTVLFRQGTAELLPESGPALDKLAAELQASPALRLRVIGHTDRLGEAGKNQVLSEQRAEAVRAYLIKAGVAAARLTTVGYGDSRPLHPSPDLRNRRVEIEKLL